MRERYGDVVSVPTLLSPWTLIFHPDGVRHVLQENHFNYNKEIFSTRVLRLVLGNGLLTNDGESWLTQRRLIQPAFHRKLIAAFGTLMTETTLIWIRRWETSHVVDTQQPFDLFQEMSHLTMSIVGQALFGADLSGAMERVEQAFTVVNRLLSEAFYLPWLLSLPTSERYRLFRARSTLYTVVEEVISQRRRQPAQNDLLSLLLEARDEETGLGMTESQVRDEVVTLLLAGHQTTEATGSTSDKYRLYHCYISILFKTT